MVWKSWEDAMLSRLDWNFKVRIRIEEHAFLQTKSLEICKMLDIHISIISTFCLTISLTYHFKILILY